MKTFEIEGQLDMFSILKSEESAGSLLPVGQKVYRVCGASVSERIVLDVRYLEGENDVKIRYNLQQPNSCYDSADENEIGKTIFTDYNDAKQKAMEYFKKNKKNILNINQEDIVSVQAYHYIRECDNRNMIAFWAELSNGMVYTKDFYTYYHILSDTVKIKKAKKSFSNSVEGYDEIPDFIPPIHIMYRCSDSDWDFADYEYASRH